MLRLALTLMLISGAEEPAVPVSRADQVRQMRETKALNLEEPTRPFLEKALYEFKERRVLEQFQRGWYGFRPLLGGMPTGAGFAAGTAYEGIAYAGKSFLKKMKKHPRITVLSSIWRLKDAQIGYKICGQEKKN